jgi:hypothetical protein
MDHELTKRCPACLGSGYKTLPLNATWVEKSNPWRTPDYPWCDGKGWIEGNLIRWDSYGVYQLKKEDE